MCIGNIIRESDTGGEPAGVMFHVKLFGVRNAKCVVRSGGRGAQNLEAPQYPFLYFGNKKTDRVMFHVKHRSIRFYTFST